MKTAELKINGMHCQSCVRRVTAAIEKVDGLKSANVAVGSANVEFDPAKTSEEEIAA
ncbi:MAG: heavy-metal-associated domain-containing protein, partial [Bryobacteraceae bacterium]